MNFISSRVDGGGSEWNLQNGKWRHRWNSLSEFSIYSSCRLLGCRAYVKHVREMGFMGELFNSTPTTTIHPYTCDVNEEHLWQYIKKNKKWKWRRIQISSEYIILNPGRHRYIVVVSCGSTSSKRGDGGGGVELVKGKSYPINVLEQGRRKELFLCVGVCLWATNGIGN